MSFDTLVRQEARLIILRALEEQPDGRLNSELLRVTLDSFGISKSRDWVHDELNWLVSMAAITVVTAGTVRGLDRRFAVRFSLLMSLPAILGSTILTLADALSAGIDTKSLPAYFIGFIVSAAVGLVSINLLRRISAKGKFGKFRYYCWCVGALTIILTFILK